MNILFLVIVSHIYCSDCQVARFPCHPTYRPYPSTPRPSFMLVCFMPICFNAPYKFFLIFYLCHHIFRLIFSGWFIHRVFFLWSYRILFIPILSGTQLGCQTRPWCAGRKSHQVVRCSKYIQ